MNFSLNPVVQNSCKPLKRALKFFSLISQNGVNGLVQENGLFIIVWKLRNKIDNPQNKCIENSAGSIGVANRGPIQK